MSEAFELAREIQENPQSSAADDAWKEVYGRCNLATKRADIVLEAGHKGRFCERLARELKGILLCSQLVIISHLTFPLPSRFPTSRESI